MRFPMRKQPRHSLQYCGTWLPGLRLPDTKALRSFLLSFEPVSHSANREQMSRARGIIFEIAAQSHDEIVNRSGVSVFSQSPHFFENGLARDHASAIAH